ncbi:hypothetical protein Poly30_21090 [Planctomycetes bacterium Poly30]|uniref:3-keto-alpha-glucoside-1,2-lyase/3-keto-2-hydroxy-glucal hydratase domain-containing protein n=1 Tax=Saltatorellus ferox TaxID=2528018 RepID=A0A518ER91_9BACT|nr:hypothetical protein Poly30_21090 [Planctomycetes bacterium Poly30]
MLDHKILLTALLASSATLLAVTGQEDKLGFQDTPTLPGTEWHVHDGLRPQPPVVTPGASAGEAPSDATILFDGSSLDAWEGGPWELKDGVMTVNGTGQIQTKDSFGDCQLHVEWRSPLPKEGENLRGQGRHNSGVFLFGRYEIQVLDCFENRTYPDGMTGAVYGQEPPMANACLPAGEWQSYDILFQAPRFSEDGALESPAQVTVLLNGVALHHARTLLGATVYRNVASYAEHGEKGPIALQDHGNPVSFRNIWVRDLKRAR